MYEYNVPGIYFCTVIVARLEGINVSFLIPCYAPERPHFLNWMDGNHCCFLYRMFPTSLPGLTCLLHPISFFFHNLSLLFFNAGPHCMLYVVGHEKTLASARLSVFILIGLKSFFYFTRTLPLTAAASSSKRLAHSRTRIF